jgi:hypothetical protein
MLFFVQFEDTMREDDASGEFDFYSGKPRGLGQLSNREAWMDRMDRVCYLCLSGHIQGQAWGYEERGCNLVGRLAFWGWGNMFGFRAHSSRTREEGTVRSRVEVRPAVKLKRCLQMAAQGLRPIHLHPTLLLIRELNTCKMDSIHVPSATFSDRLYPFYWVLTDQCLRKLQL